jgi:PLP dependent protein
MCMSEITKNIVLIKKQIPSSVRLVVVSKTKSAGDILEAYNTGHKMFGENRVQEIISKKDQLPADIEWHFIGHLQTNKVRLIVPFVDMIESVDSFRLLSVIDAEALKTGRLINCLLQIHIAQEETKFGFSKDELRDLAESEKFQKLKSVRICGVMGMATFTNDEEQIRNEFRYLRECSNYLKIRFFKDALFNEISMGMSGDYKIAIEEGSTIIRIGSLIFGERKI